MTTTATQPSPTPAFSSVDSWDSFEGVPDWIPPPPRAQAAVKAEAENRGAIAGAGHATLVWLSTLLPGLALAAILAWVGVTLSVWLGRVVFHVPPEGKSPLSPILLAIVLGLFIRNAFGVPKAYDSGLKWCTRTILRTGIVLMGLSLSLAAVAKIGLIGLPIIAGCILTALVAVTWLNRALGLPRRLGTLIAVGTSICGVTAIVATAPAIDADEDETSYAVACITIFGLLALFIYPFVAHWLFGDQFTQAGLFLGTAIHDTAQVAGAAAMFNDQYHAPAAQNAAVTIKLVRNLSMSLLIPVLAFTYHRAGRREAAKASGFSSASSAARRQPWHQVVPLFVIGFAAMAALRSIADQWGGRVVDEATLKSIYHRAADASLWCLAAAMASVGLGTGFARLRGLGWRPFTVGFFAAGMVGVASWALIRLLVRA